MTNVPREIERLAELRAYDILDTPSEPSFDRLCRAAADICDAPVALICLVDEQRQWFKSRIGLTVAETPREIAFCAHAIEDDSIFEVPDAERDIRFADNPLVTDAPYISFYAGAPLCTPAGNRLGTLCVIDSKSRPDGLTSTQSSVLRTLAAQVVVELELRRTLSLLQWSVDHDALTGLANRVLFHKRLDQALADRSTRENTSRLAVALLDLDHFKRVNDVQGHDAGDALLKDVAQRLNRFVRPGETAARLGGDEFILILPDCGGDAQIDRRLNELLEDFRRPFSFQGAELEARASIGVALSPDHGCDGMTLLKRADLAMYQAKSAGRNTVRTYHHSFGTKLQRKVDGFRAVRSAMQRGDLFPYYQSQVRLGTGEHIGCEALVRLRDTDDKIILPKAIEDALEDSDVGVDIGACMLDHVISDLRKWLDDGVNIGHVSINASAAELKSANYAERLLQALAVARVPSACLQVEVTEGVFLGRGSERVRDTLNTLSSAGILIALDDFGTGFASLSHLQRFPVKIIKIDRSFIANLETSAGDATIVGAVIGLASNLGMQVVAEGVETAGQVRLLRAMGCDIAQGYHFGRPLCAGRVIYQRAHRGALWPAPAKRVRAAA